MENSEIALELVKLISAQMIEASKQSGKHFDPHELKTFFSEAFSAILSALPAKDSTTKDKAT